MDYTASLIHMTATLESSDSFYSLVCLEAHALSLTLGDVRCFLDGRYLLCLSIDDMLTVTDGEYEVMNLHFLPCFYNVNLNHTVIGLPLYAEMRALYGYPDFTLFRLRNDRFHGILPLNTEEYENVRIHFQKARQYISRNEQDPMWSCRTRSEIISILRIAESVKLGEPKGKGSEILRYIRDHLGEELTLSSLSALLHTNRTTLTQTVKDLTGMSPMQYVLEERLNQSRPDLLFTYIPIQELAPKYGFPSVNYYIRAFKKRFGKTPLQYRIEGREKRIREETIYHEKAKRLLQSVSDTKS